MSGSEVTNILYFPSSTQTHWALLVNTKSSLPLPPLPSICAWVSRSQSVLFSSIDLFSTFVLRSKKINRNQSDQGCLQMHSVIVISNFSFYFSLSIVSDTLLHLCQRVAPVYFVRRRWARCLLVLPNSWIAWSEKCIVRNVYVVIVCVEYPPPSNIYAEFIFNSILSLPLQNGLCTSRNQRNS